MATLKIQTGDTLGKISARYNTTVDELLRLNPTIADRNKIQAGASLTLPDKTLEATPSKNLDAVPDRTLPPSHTGKLVSFLDTLQKADELAQAKRLQFANEFAGGTFKPGVLGAGDFVQVLAALSGASSGQAQTRGQIINAFSQDVNDINDVAKTAASFDAPESVITKILSSKSVGEAAINARGYLRAREKPTEGSKISIAEWKSLYDTGVQLPASSIGQSQDKIILDLQGDVPPVWFTKSLEAKYGQKLPADKVLLLWGELKKDFVEAKPKPKGDNPFIQK